MSRLNRSPQPGVAGRSESLGANDPRGRRAAQAPTQTHTQFGAGIAIDRKGRPSIQAGAGLEVTSTGVRILNQGPITPSAGGTDTDTKLNQVIAALTRAGLVN